MAEFCPHCQASLQGGLIWEHFYEKFQVDGYWLDENGKYLNDHYRVLDAAEAAVVADEVAGNYGATRTEGRWGLAIGEYCMERDRIVSWTCPECGGKWDR